MTLNQMSQGCVLPVLRVRARLSSLAHGARSSNWSVLMVDSQTLPAEATVADEKIKPAKITGGKVNLFGTVVDLKPSRKVKKSLFSAAKKDNATVETVLGSIDGQIADLMRARAALTAHKDDAEKLAHGVSLVGGGNSPEANFKALVNYAQGMI